MRLFSIVILALAGCNTPVPEEGTWVPSGNIQTESTCPEGYSAAQFAPFLDSGIQRQYRLSSASTDTLDIASSDGWEVYSQREGRNYIAYADRSAVYDLGQWNISGGPITAVFRDTMELEFSSTKEGTLQISTELSCEGESCEDFFGRLPLLGDATFPTMPCTMTMTIPLKRSYSVPFDDSRLEDSSAPPPAPEPEEAPLDGYYWIENPRVVRNECFADVQTSTYKVEISQKGEKIRVHFPSGNTYVDVEELTTRDLYEGYYGTNNGVDADGLPVVYHYYYTLELTNDRPSIFEEITVVTFSDDSRCELRIESDVNPDE